MYKKVLRKKNKECYIKLLEIDDQHLLIFFKCQYIFFSNLKYKGLKMVDFAWVLECLLFCLKEKAL